MKYKKSNYNIVNKINDKIIIFNTLTKALVELDDKIFKLIENNNIDLIDDDYIENLLDNGIVVSEEYNEILELKKKYWLVKTSKNILHLTILTTLDCNFQCTYCFEERKSEYLKCESEEKIVRFIEKNMENYNGLHIDFYGGEPLLNLEKVETISNRVNNISRKFDIPVLLTMTTNGYLLNEENCNIISQLGISVLQVTIDGPKVIHDARRVLRNGQGTFDQIISNLSRIKNTFIINLRINVDKESINYLDELFELLMKHKLSEVNLAIKAIVPSESNPYNDELLSQSELAKETLKKVKKWKELGGKVNYNLLTQNIYRFCIVDLDSQYIISPNGSIFKCGESYDIKKDKGYIGELTDVGELDINQFKRQFWDKDPFDDQKCIECNVLPICLGGCQMKRKIKKEAWCNSEMKYTIHNYVQLYYNDIIR